MERHGIKRFTCESSLGVGDSRGQLGWLFNVFIIPLLLRNVFRDKETQQWTISAQAVGTSLTYSFIE